MCYCKLVEKIREPYVAYFDKVPASSNAKRTCNISLNSYVKVKAREGYSLLTRNTQILNKRIAEVYFECPYLYLNRCKYNT